jgi:uncharacterized membrane protein YkvA (DUF1232 family)
MDETLSTPGVPADADITDEQFAESVSDISQSEPLNEGRAQRFYDRVRTAIHEYVERKGGGVVGKTAEFLLLVPDVFILLWRLAGDGRVEGKNKVLVGSAVAYFIFPFDIMPEALMGPVGYLDDLVFGVYVLNKILRDTDPSILRQHWSGSSDVLDSIQKVLNAADSLVGSDFLGRIKKMMK